MSKLAKNTLYLTIASIGQKIIAFLYFTLITRYFGADGTGVYFLALAITTVMAVFEDFGVTSVLIREIAKAPKKATEWVRNVIGIKCFTIPITVLAVLFLPRIFGYGGDVINLVYIAVFVMIADTISLSFYGVLRGLHTLKYESFGIFIGQIITATFGLFLLITGKATLPLLILALILGSMWNMSFSLYQVVKHLGIKSLIPSWSMGLTPLKMAFAFFLAAVFVKIYSYVDSFILAKVLGDSAVGFYAVAYKLTYSFQFLPLAFVAALYPTISAQQNDTEQLKKTLLDAFWYMSFLAVPIVFGIWSLAPEIILFFNGSGFLNSVLPLQLLIFVLIFIFLDFPIGSLLNATNRQAVKTALMGVTMIINIVANILLIPRLGVSGASIAAIISFVFLFAGGWFFTKKIIPITFFDLLKRIGVIFIVGFLMALIVLFVKIYVHFTFAIIIGAISYFFFGFLLGAFGKGELGSFLQLLKRKKL